MVNMFSELRTLEEWSKHHADFRIHCGLSRRYRWTRLLRSQRHRKIQRGDLGVRQGGLVIFKIVFGAGALALLAIGLGRRIKHTAKDLEALAEEEYREREERLRRTEPPQQ